jgi:hypothetical protein
MSKPDQVLYLSDQYLACSDVTEGGLDVKFKLSLTEFGAEEKLANFLKSNTFGLISVFIDVMGTEIKQDKVPHVTGNDLKLLLDRKSQSMFPAADFVWNEHVKREKAGRKDDVFLFIGISLSPILKHILETLESSNNKVNGIYSIAALQQELSKGLPKFSQSLVISRVLESNIETKSFRQSYYREGKLVISRVNTVADAYSGSAAYDQLFDEIERTYQFLQGSSQLDSTSTLKVISLLTEKESGLLFNHQKHVDIDFNYASFDDVSKQLGLKLSKPCKSLPEVLGNLAMSKNLKPHFKPKQLCETYHVAKTKSTLVLGSVVAIVFAVVVSSWLWFQGIEIDNSIENLNVQALDSAQLESDLVKSAIKTEVLPKAMKQSVELFSAIDARTHKPDYVLGIISRAYEGYKDLEIRKIVWQEAAEGIKDEESSGFFMDVLKMPKLISITMRPIQKLDNRVVLERLESFKSSLLNQPEIKKVEQEKSAIDVRSNAKLEESFGGEQDIDKTSEFTLVITL